MNSPIAVTADSAGNVYIADTGNERIRKINASTGIITTVAGNGSEDIGADGLPAISVPLANPIGLTTDAQGNLYFAEQANNKIRKLSATSHTLSTVAGSGVPGFRGDGGFGPGAELYAPSGVALDPAGNMYISDSGNNIIRKVAAGTGVITTVVGTGAAGFGGDGGPAKSALLNFPFGIATDAAGNIYIADAGNACIRKVTVATGIITTIAGSTNVGFAGDGGPAVAASFSNPLGVALDSSGNVYIADYPNGRIRKVDAGTGIINTVAGNGATATNPLEQNPAGDGGLAEAAQLVGPSGVALDSAGNLYIADYDGNRIRFVLGG